MTPWLWLLAAYFAGSLPTSYVVGKAIGGMDLRREGSGNLGATNVYRAMGLRVAVPVALVDIGKGWLPAWLFPMLDGGAASGWAAAYGAAAILGHTFSCWMRFRGGKGVATAAGAFLALSPVAVLAAAAVWVLVFAGRGIVSLASIAAAVALPAVVVVGNAVRGAGDPWVAGLAVLSGAFIVWAHRSNIGRLLRGEEGRISDDRRARRGEDG
ncbi:MAG: glycerol-3-phosphate 1-O-acyltransferase PlsY [Gammaproteobacteria bacterium]|nr:glycerol-3-phosphate 1-O-acyltransferase PlsY [Gammaproteobacteria bacterium]